MIEPMKNSFQENDEPFRSKPVKKQIPFRCDAELELKLIKARGEWMIRNGQRISSNDFLILVITKGLSVF